jgi:hypothetical protein
MKSLLGEFQMGELAVLTHSDVLAEVQGQVGLITLNRAKALMAVDKTLSLEGAMQKAALAAAAGTLSVADTRANTAADATRAKIREKYSWIDMLPANDPTKKAMAAERDRALAAVGGGAGLPDAVPSVTAPKVKFVGYE